MRNEYDYTVDFDAIEPGAQDADCLSEIAAITEQFRYGDLFTLKDHILVKRAMASVLTDNEQEAIILRFWIEQTLFEIGEALAITYVEADRLVNRAMLKIREYCLRHPEFSRKFFPES